MPELPDVVAYIAALEPRVVGRRLAAVRLASPFLLRTFDPPIREVEGRRVVGLRRLGKRLVFDLENNLHIVLHLMISGRLHWRASGAKLAGKMALAAFDFENGTLVLTEASSRKGPPCIWCAARQPSLTSSAEASRCSAPIWSPFGGR